MRTEFVFITGVGMPQRYTLVEQLKMFTGSTSSRVQWERQKATASKIVDVSVFKDGLGPATDKTADAVKAYGEAQAKAKRAKDKSDAVKESYPLDALLALKAKAEAGDQRATVEAKQLKAEATKRQDTADDEVKKTIADVAKRHAAYVSRLDALLDVFQGYVSIAEKKVAAPADKLSKATGPTAPDKQKAEWKRLGKWLFESHRLIAKHREMLVNDRGQYT